ncbi:MAG TPA: glutathione S-transferase [Hyphomicrobiales bacterium]|nr:glutathione S-transferase [Rhodobiaceae bacterium]HXK53398.1 glutathione S-transferase [Hyphomicrobiales bacterium]
MKLFDNTRAPNPRRARIFLAEKGIEIPTVQLSVVDKECQTPEFVETKNAMQRIPVLELDDGTCISESVAICRYFEALQPDPPLMGRSPLEQAQIEMWNRRMELDLFWRVTYAFRHTSPAMSHLQIPQVPEWAEANRGYLEEELAWLDGEMAKRPFIAGENFSIADITAVVAIDFARIIGRRLDEATPNLLRWHGEIAARPSYKA